MAKKRMKLSYDNSMIHFDGDWCTNGYWAVSRQLLLTEFRLNPKHQALIDTGVPFSCNGSDFLIGEDADPPSMDSLLSSIGELSSDVERTGLRFSVNDNRGEFVDGEIVIVTDRETGIPAIDCVNPDYNFLFELNGRIVANADVSIYAMIDGQGDPEILLAGMTLAHSGSPSDWLQQLRYQLQQASRIMEIGEDDELSGKGNSK